LIALAIAGAIGTSGYSPVPEAPKGPFSLGIFRGITSISGISLVLRILNLAKLICFIK